MTKAAGVLLEARSGRLLLLLRKDCECWSVPGGHIENGESEEQAAERELYEEVGHITFTLYEAPVRHGGFALFYGQVDRQFMPWLNEEHTRYGWFFPDELPLPLHRGLRYQIRKLGVV